MPLTLLLVPYYSNLFKMSGALSPIFQKTQTGWDTIQYLHPRTAGDIPCYQALLAHIEGRQFYVLTDHRPLTYFLLSSPNRHSPRQIRHLDYISQFTSDIHHIQGSNNQAADALSQVQAVSQNSSPVIHFEQLAIAQRDNPELSKLRTTTNSSDLRDISLPVSEPCWQP